ncbi:MAG TPA: hypothetical protein VLG68_07565 [Gammaproteobacteria bacterium]|nr:hypothetical protein [Gammaproteobacteria bacterium]
MSLHPLLAGLKQSPDFFLQNLDLVNRRGLVVRLSEAGFRRASFLDDRGLEPGTQGAWFPLAPILERAAELATPPPPLAIFHVSHCGSTLLSRLLAELPGCLPLREPLTFLTLAMERRELGRPAARLDPEGWSKLFAACLKFLSRAYRPDERVLIKATSACTNLAKPFLSHDAGGRALFLYTQLEPWLATMLGSEANRENGRAYAPAWLMDFHALTGRDEPKLAELSDAEQFTLNWLTGMLTAERARAEFPYRVRTLDFDAFLQDTAGGLTASGSFFGLDTSNAAVVAAGPLMQRYAKNPSQIFDAGTRKVKLEEARRTQADELRAGLAFAEKLCRDIPALKLLDGYFRRS